MKVMRRTCLAAMGALGVIAGMQGEARAELSQRSQGIVWNVEHWVYLSKCRFDKPTTNPDSYYLSDCEYSLDQENRNLAALTPAELKDPAAKAALDIHAKSTAYVTKLLSDKKSSDAKAKVEGDAYDAFRQDVSDHESALRFLQKLESKSDDIWHDLEPNVTKALALGDFANKCASYTKMPPRKRVFTTQSTLSEDPALVCRLATSRSDILKREMPRVLTKLRTDATDKSKSRRDDIAKGKAITASDLACAKDSSKCGEDQVKANRMAQQVGLPVANAASEAAAFAEALKKATAAKRIGTLHDAAREGAVVRAVRANGITPIATGIYRPADDVKKNDIGIPKSRERGVSVLIRVGSEPFCRSYMAYAVSEYEGGGRYGAFDAESFDVDGDDFLVSSCK